MNIYNHPIPIRFGRQAPQVRQPKLTEGIEEPPKSTFQIETLEKTTSQETHLSKGLSAIGTGIRAIPGKKILFSFAALAVAKGRIPQKVLPVGILPKAIINFFKKVDVNGPVSGKNANFLTWILGSGLGGLGIGAVTKHFLDAKTLAKLAKEKEKAVQDSKTATQELTSQEEKHNQTLSAIVSNHQAEKTALEAEKAKLKNEKIGLETKISQLEQTSNKALNDKTDLENQLRAASSKRDALIKEKNQLESELGSEKAKITEGINTYEKENSTLKERINAINQELDSLKNKPTEEIPKQGNNTLTNSIGTQTVSVEEAKQEESQGGLGVKSEPLSPPAETLIPSEEQDQTDPFTNVPVQNQKDSLPQNSSGESSTGSLSSKAEENQKEHTVDTKTNKNSTLPGVVEESNQESEEVRAEAELVEGLNSFEINNSKNSASFFRKVFLLQKNYVFFLTNTSSSRFLELGGNIWKNAQRNYSGEDPEIKNAFKFYNNLSQTSQKKLVKFWHDNSKDIQEIYKTLGSKDSPVGSKESTTQSPRRKMPGGWESSSPS